MATEGPLGPRPPGGLSPRTRLIAGACVAIAGGVFAQIALRADWHESACTGRSAPVPGGGSVYLTRDLYGFSGVDIAPWLGPVAAIMALLPAVALMLDRRPRALLLIITALIGLILMIGVFSAPGYTAIQPAELRTDGSSCREVDTAWRSLAFLGGLVTLAGVGLAAKPAAVVPKLGLPERPPSEEEVEP